MPASVPLEDLQRAHAELQALEMKYPDTYYDLGIEVRAANNFARRVA